MMIKHIVIQLVVLFLLTPFAFCQKEVTADICVYGGTSAGIIAAYTATKHGKTAIVIEPSSFMGGLTTGGLCHVDVNQRHAVAGLAQDFFRRIGDHYKEFEQWTYEPHVAEEVLKQYVTQGNFIVLQNHGIRSVEKVDNVISKVVIQNLRESDSIDLTVNAKIFLDCSYEGDLIAKAGISYQIGRESSSTYDEPVSGFHFNENTSVAGTSSKKESHPSTLSNESKGHHSKKTEEADDAFQAYSYRVCLSSVPENRIPIARPLNYDSSRYQFLLNYLNAGPDQGKLSDYFSWQKLPNGKVEVTAHDMLPSDLLTLSREYLQSDYQQRIEIARTFQNYFAGLWFFIGNDKRVPESLRRQMKMWGYAADEFTANGNWPGQLEITEGRRMTGDVVITQHHVEGKRNMHGSLIPITGKIDTRTHRLIVDGKMFEEGRMSGNKHFSFSIPFAAMTPKEEEAINFLAPVCLSASHIAFSAIRSECVFMMLGQAAATAACVAIDEGIPVQQINVEKLKLQLRRNPLADGTLPDVLVDNTDRDRIEFNGGKWPVVAGEGYRSSLLLLTHDEKRKRKSVKFSAGEIRGGEYDLYFFIPPIPHLSRLIMASIFDGYRSTQRLISPNSVLIKQEEGGWFYLGRYRIEENSNPFVEISSDGADGKIVADAVLWTPADDFTINAERQ